MRRTIKTCVDRIVPEHLRIEAARLAIEENAANVPVLHEPLGFGVEPPTPARLALVTSKKWANGRELRVHFLDGHPDVQAKVEEYAHQWSKHANIKFKFGYDPSAEIRISFEQEGSWSYLGTDALVIPRPEPTMNYGWLTPGSAEDEFRRVVTHEFGHALGSIHEHQHPEAGIPWDKEAVYRYFMGPPNNWTKEDTDHNLFERYDKTITNFSAYDKDSIMHYPISNDFTLGDFEVGWNASLSSLDKDFMGIMYPKKKEPETMKLSVGAPPVEEAIGKHGEEDLYEMPVAAKGTYKIETSGSTDVVMVLLGPNSLTKKVAEDDDSGRAYNAKIVSELNPGTYHVRVRHYLPRATGKYRIAAARAN